MRKNSVYLTFDEVDRGSTPMWRLRIWPCDPRSVITERQRFSYNENTISIQIPDSLRVITVCEGGTNHEVLDVAQKMFGVPAYVGKGGWNNIGDISIHCLQPSDDEVANKKAGLYDPPDIS